MGIQLVSRFELHKEGFGKMVIEKYLDRDNKFIYRQLSHVYANGDKRWTWLDTKLVEDYISSLPADVTMVVTIE